MMKLTEGLSKGYRNLETRCKDCGRLLNTDILQDAWQIDVRDLFDADAYPLNTPLSEPPNE